LRQVKPKQIIYHRRYQNLQYFDVSVRTAYNIEKPIEYIIRKLVGDSELTIEVEADALL
jgi:GTP-binding nuclear protein Ran